MKLLPEIVLALFIAMTGVAMACPAGQVPCGQNSCCRRRNRGPAPQSIKPDRSERRMRCLFRGSKNIRESSKTLPWIISAFAMVFALVSPAVLLSDVTRDDVVALHHGFDGVRFSQAEVGSFFEVAEGTVHGPLCTGWFEKSGAPTRKNVVAINKLGETLPILTDWLGGLFRNGKYTGTSIAHVVKWRIDESTVAPDELWEYTRGVMDERGTCSRSIDQLTKSRDVRICPVHRVWKNEEGQAVAIFFDTYAINGCPADDPDCSDLCPRFVDGQVWTKIKLKLDLIEASGV